MLNSVIVWHNNKIRVVNVSPKYEHSHYVVETLDGQDAMGAQRWNKLTQLREPKRDEDSDEMHKAFFYMIQEYERIKKHGKEADAISA